MTDVLSLALSLVALIFAALAAKLSQDNKIQLEAQKLSTHKIQYVPLDDLQSFGLNDPPMTDETKLKLTKDPFEEL